MDEQQLGTERHPATPQTPSDPPFPQSTLDGPRTLVTRQKNNADSTPPQSIYNPLPADGSFRLLQLYPGRGTDAIRCKLKPTPIDLAIDTYEAISYVWGDPNITEDIICNDVQVAVTTNLANALRSFRLPEASRVVWADAICINQQDVDERSSQVKMMDQVYEKAKGVLSWLGPDSDGIARECFSLLTDTNEYLDDYYLRYNKNGNPRALPPLPEPLPHCLERRRWLHVKTLLNLPYFTRAWVAQEVALAKECELWWGMEHISLAHIFEFVLWYHTQLDFKSILTLLNLQMGVRTLLRLFLNIHSRYDTKKSWRYALPLVKYHSSVQLTDLFLGVLDAGRLTKATNPRDHIYAFLGSPMAKTQNGMALVEPNYSLSVEDVYFETACALLQNDREARWLLGHVVHASLESLMNPATPSWVPVWNTYVNQSQLADPGCWFRAGGTHQVHTAKVDHASKTLQVAGYIFDKIAWLSETIYGHNLKLNPHFWTSELRATGQPLIDRLWESVSAFRAVDEDDFTLTMMAEYPAAKAGIVAMDMHREKIALYQQHLRAMISAPDGQEIRNASKMSKVRDCEFELQVSRRSRVAITEQGRLALVPGATTRIGDVCCVILGVSMPFVLTRDAEQRNRLVGDCYIRGCMRGEIVTQIKEGVLKKETITIT